MNQIEELKDGLRWMVDELEGEPDTVYQKRVWNLYNQILAILDAQGKLAEGEYESDIVSGDYCVVSKEDHVVMFRCVTSGDSTVVASLLNSQGAEIKEYRATNVMLDQANRYHQSQLTTAKARVANLEGRLPIDIVHYNNALVKQNQQLREALGFYADDSNYDEGHAPVREVGAGPDHDNCEIDQGYIARQALKELNDE